MKEHPIPQDITGYNFHIIGNMTIKQFAEVGVGIGIAFLIYSTNLINFVKFPLMLLVAGIGAAAAFVPFEDRPLDHWLIVFVRTLYQPTKYFWKREPKIPDVFNYQPNKTQKTQVDEVDLTPARRERIKEYVSSINLSRNDQDEFDIQTRQQEAQVLDIFNDKSLAQTVDAVKAVKQITKPELKVKVRSLGGTYLDESQTSQETVVFENNSPAQTPIQPVPAPEIDMSELQNANYKQQALNTKDIARNIEVPELEKIKVEDSSQLTAEDQTVIQQQTQQSGMSYVHNQNRTNNSNTDTQATQNKDLPFPDPPDQPNKLVGMVLTPSNELIDHALIEINDINGNTIRAIKTNALGQFFISSPLRDGEYFIETSKSGFSFAPVKLILDGQIVAPIEIRSQTN